VNRVFPLPSHGPGLKTAAEILRRIANHLDLGCTLRRALMFAAEGLGPVSAARLSNLSTALDRGDAWQTAVRRSMGTLSPLRVLADMSRSGDPAAYCRCMADQFEAHRHSFSALATSVLYPLSLILLLDAAWILSSISPALANAGIRAPAGLMTGVNLMLVLLTALVTSMYAKSRTAIISPDLNRLRRPGVLPVFRRIMIRSALMRLERRNDLRFPGGDCPGPILSSRGQ
jgi:type II secretory pathway component PulF